MAQIAPFRALRYNPRRVDPSKCITQPYDKITPEMQEAYYQASPHNLVRIVLGRRDPDVPGNNVYTRAAGFFEAWRRDGIFLQDPEPSLYVCAQRFQVPGEATERERRGFIALGRIEDYSANVVFRHEQTLAKPKADRLDLLRATRAHFGQIFMLYDDPGEIERLLMNNSPADTEVRDEYGVMHRLWRVSDPAVVNQVQAKMRGQKLIIADGHHRYETALTYRNERRADASTPSEDAPYEMVMMTFVNMNSEGLMILPTHRVVHGLGSFTGQELVSRSRKYFDVEEIDATLDSAGAMALLRKSDRIGTAILAVTPKRSILLHSPRREAALFGTLSVRQQALDVVQLHKVVLEKVLGLSEESIRNQENLSYIRDAQEAINRVRGGLANAAFLMNPVRMTQVRDIAFAGEVLPQKSTDFYPKLLTGMAIYPLQ
jgi:uncharacterized protein (DUF1015 family)